MLQYFGLFVGKASIYLHYVLHIHGVLWIKLDLITFFLQLYTVDECSLCRRVVCADIQYTLNNDSIENCKVPLNNKNKFVSAICHSTSNNIGYRSKYSLTTGSRHQTSNLSELFVLQTDIHFIEHRLKIKPCICML